MPPSPTLTAPSSLQPDDPALRYNRAFAYQSAGRWVEALDDLDVAAALAPDDPDIIAAREACRLRTAPA